jgi:hypothetical protein
VRNFKRLIDADDYVAANVSSHLSCPGVWWLAHYVNLGRAPQGLSDADEIEQRFLDEWRTSVTQRVIAALRVEWVVIEGQLWAAQRDRGSRFVFEAARAVAHAEGQGVT